MRGDPDGTERLHRSYHLVRVDHPVRAKTLLKLNKAPDAVKQLDQALAAYPQSPDVPLLTLTRIDALYEQPQQRKTTPPLYAAFAAKYPNHDLAAHARYMSGFPSR